MVKSNLNDLSKMIVQSVKDYTTEVQDDIKKGAKKIAKEAAQELKSAGSFKDRTRSYRKGWRAKSVKGEGEVVHNLTDAQRTHLLEKGHALRRGGRSIGRVSAKVHIAPVEEKAVDEFTKMVERAIKR